MALAQKQTAISVSPVAVSSLSKTDNLLSTYSRTDLDAGKVRSWLSTFVC